MIQSLIFIAAVSGALSIVLLAALGAIGTLATNGVLTYRESMMGALIPSIMGWVLMTVLMSVAYLL